MRTVILLVAALLTGCNAIAPTAPARVAPVAEIVISTPPPVALTPLTIEMNLGRAEVLRGSGLSLSAAVTGTPTAPATYAWIFGDGQRATTTDARASHTYAQTGTFDASVEVSDGSGRTARSARQITVVNPPPPPATPRDEPPPPATLGATLACTPRVAGTPTPCNVTVTYEGRLPSAAVKNVDWDWGDGVPVPAFTPGPSTEHVYVRPGTYTVIATVRATTKAGSKTATATKTIDVP